MYVGTQLCVIAFTHHHTMQEDAGGCRWTWRFDYLQNAWRARASKGPTIHFFEISKKSRPRDDAGRFLASIPSLEMLPFQEGLSIHYLERDRRMWDRCMCHGLNCYHISSRPRDMLHIPELAKSFAVYSIDIIMPRLDPQCLSMQHRRPLIPKGCQPLVSEYVFSAPRPPLPIPRQGHADPSFRSSSLAEAFCSHIKAMDHVFLVCVLQPGTRHGRSLTSGRAILPPYML